MRNISLSSRLMRFVPHRIYLHGLIGQAFVWLIFGAVWAEPAVVLPKYRLGAAELGVIVNQRDPLSRQIADYYMARRGIPEQNRIGVSLPSDRKVISAKDFAPIHAEIQRQTPPGVKAYALTWTRPYRVECMSIGTAISGGFDRAWCSAKTCARTRLSPLFPRPEIER